MVHHVGFEIAPEAMAPEGEFWVAAGFSPVGAPESLGTGFHWYEREGTQIHLMETDDPAPPPARGHVAVVAPDIDATIRRLEAGGYQVTEGRQHWGERRIKAITPSGHAVELMAAPPEPSTGENVP